MVKYRCGTLAHTATHIFVAGGLLELHIAFAVYEVMWSRYDIDVSLSLLSACHCMLESGSSIFAVWVYIA